MTAPAAKFALQILPAGKRRSLLIKAFETVLADEMGAEGYPLRSGCRAIRRRTDGVPAQEKTPYGTSGHDDRGNCPGLPCHA